MRHLGRDPSSRAKAAATTGTGLSYSTTSLTHPMLSIVENALPIPLT
jgi:hypothetical protein